MHRDRAVHKETSGLKLILRTFRYRNYRLFFGGQGISLVGTWMQRIAMSWLVYRLTNSVFLLGLVGFLGQFPTFVLAPFAGVIADRMNRRNILIVTQILAMLQALILAVLVLTNTVAVWHIVVLSIFLAVINGFDIPARQAFVVEMVEKREDLVNAIALNSGMFNGARLLGPSVAGVLIAAVGEGMCFLLNAISFIAVIVAYLFMKIAPKKVVNKGANIFQELREGVTYTLGFPPIRYVLLLLGLVNLVGMPYTILMPVFAKDILHGSSRTLGFLMAAVGVGALVGAVFLASRRSAAGLGKVILIATSVFAVGLIGFSLSHVLWISLVFLVATGLGMMVQMASSNTVLQTVVDDDKRGRVMGFFAMAFMGAAPIGSILGGSLAGKIGAPNTVMIGGLCCVLGALLWARVLPAFRRMVRPIYVKKGVISEVALGIQAATELPRFFSIIIRRSRKIDPPR